MGSNKKWLTLDPSKYVWDPIRCPDCPVHHGVPISKLLAVSGAGRLKWDERVVPLQLIRQPKVGVVDPSNSFAALLESLSEISGSRDKVGTRRVPDKLWGGRGSVKEIVELRGKMIK
jgi:hypothetical protein